MGRRTFFWKARGINQCQPAALAQANQVDRRSKFVYRNIEVGKVVEATALTAYIGFGGEGVRDFRSNTAFLSDSYEIR